MSHLIKVWRKLFVILIHSALMIRFFDFFFSLLGLVFLFPIFLILCLLGFLDTGSPLFFQKRVGRNKTEFTLVKFRTMKPDSTHVATHLMNASQVTSFGRFLRKSKLDELPQLWNVIKGEMSLVGPRPCLFNQEHLIEVREALDVLSARPGITGLAQINHIDMSTPELLAKTDAEMLRTLSLGAYFKYILQTVAGSGQGDRVQR